MRSSIVIRMTSGPVVLWHALLLLVAGLGACSAHDRPAGDRTERLEPPVAIERVTVVKSPHGERRDEYYWLRDDHPERKSDEVMAHLRAEQAHTEGMFARLAPLQDRLAGEFRARIADDDGTPRQFDHGWWTWTAFSPGDEQQRWMRSRARWRRAGHARRQ
jgi:protease II